MVREKFQRKRYFFHEKDSNLNSRIIRTSVFLHWTSTFYKKWVENTVFAIQHIGNRKSFTEVLPPPPPVTKLILLHTVVNRRLSEVLLPTTIFLCKSALQCAAVRLFTNHHVINIRK